MSLDKLKSKAIQEFAYFNERLNIDFSKEFNFPNEIARATTIKEIQKIREEMAYNSCLAVLFSCKTMIKYYSGCFIDTTKYNNELSELVEKLDTTQNEKPNLDDLNKIFKETKKLFTKLKENQDNLIKQGNLKFLKSIYPIWATIFSVGYLTLVGYLNRINKLEVSLSLLILGWLLIIILVGSIIRGFAYPWKKPEILK